MPFFHKTLNGTESQRTMVRCVQALRWRFLKDRWWFQICFIFKFDTYCILQFRLVQPRFLGTNGCPRLPLFGPLVVGSDARASEVLFRFLDWLFAIFPFSFMRFAVFVIFGSPSLICLCFLVTWPADNLHAVTGLTCEQRRMCERVLFLCPAIPKAISLKSFHKRPLFYVRIYDQHIPGDYYFHGRLDLQGLALRKAQHKTNVQVAHEALASSIEDNSTRPLAKLFAEALTDGVCEWLCYIPEM